MQINMRFKKYFTSFLLILSILVSPAFAVQNTDIITLWINDKPLQIDVAPQIFSSRVLVPFRPILEAIGAKVTWDPNSQTAFALKSPVAIALKPNSKDAFVNGIPIPLDVPVRFLNGRLLVPTRFVSERLGADVAWLESKRQVRITFSDATIVTKENESSGNTQNPETAVSVSRAVNLGDSVAELLEVRGQPKEILLNQYGFYWYVYHNQYKQFELIGVRQKTVVAKYTQASIEVGKSNLTTEMNQREIQGLLGKPLTDIQRGNVLYAYSDKAIDIFNVNNQYIRVFYDSLNNQTVRSFMVLSSSEEKNLKGYYGQLSDDIQRNHEYLLFLLVNGSRVQAGLSPLVWAPEVLESARMHSVDMAARGFFSHTNPDGKEPYQRLEATGLGFTATAENLAAGQFDPVHAHEALMNSSGHKKNILGNMQKLGVGVATGGHYSIYFTCTFYTPE